MYIAHPESFAALGDPTRLAILARLAEGEADVGELAEPFGLSQPTISHHIKVLEKAGLIERRRVGTRRPCRIAVSQLTAIADHLNRLRLTLEANYMRLDALLEESQNEQHDIRGSG